MKRKILDWLGPFLVASGSLLFIIFWVWLSKNGAANPTRFWGGLAQSLELVDVNLAVSVLRAVNVATVVYGIVFYVLEDKENGTFIRTITIVLLPTILGVVPYSVRYVLANSFHVPNDDMVLVTSHYATSMLLLLYFYAADRSKFVRSKDRKRASVFGFASMYVSAPSFWALLSFLLLHIVLVPLGLKASGEGSLFFLAGASATILFLSNLLLSLSEAPYYAPYIRLIVAPRRSTREDHTMLGKLIVTGVASAIVGVLAYFAAITVTFIPGVAAIYPATAAEAAFGAWFGIWGAIASYIGLLIAGTMSGWFGVANGLVLATSDFLMALAPAVAIRVFGVDPLVRRVRDMFYFVAATLLLGSLPGSLIYNYVNLKLGVIAGWNSYWFAVLGWNVGNLVVLVLLGIPIMRFGTPVIKRVDLFFSKMF